jgi:hypothetical protein
LGKSANARYGKQNFTVMQKSMRYKYFQANANVTIEGACGHTYTLHSAHLERSES